MKGIRIRCQTCNTWLEEAEARTDGLSLGEKGDVLLKLAGRLAWAASVTDGNLEVVCPGCVDARDKLLSTPFEAFSSKNRCPKCGCDKISTRFCTGLTHCLGVAREHLHRTCQRCAYDWKQETKDHEHSHGKPSDSGPRSDVEPARQEVASASSILETVGVGDAIDGNVDRMV